VIWKQKSVAGQMERWPAEIEQLWGLDSRDPLPFEAVHGQIFNRYPGLFRFSVEGQENPFDFYLVPLHLKAMEEGSVRRRLASKLLARAIKLMTEKYGKDQDWVIGGDFNAELASRDFAPLQDADFQAMSATDEGHGAFSYIKSPRSLIDHIFLSNNLARRAGSDSYFVVAKEKSVDNYVAKLSDHRPVLVRISFKAGGREALHEAELDRIADELFAGRVNGGALARRGRAAAVKEVLESDTGFSFQTEGLSKERFLRTNRSELQRLIGGVNDELRRRHGEGFKALNAHDAWVLFYCEAGLEGGRVDPNHRHSEGERGLLPLPDKIRDWNGPDAPRWDRPMPVDTNIWHFMLYLGQLKNKVVANIQGMRLYPDLFRQNSVDGVPEREAKVLAGVVHGYFYSGTYSDRRVPFAHLLEAYRNDVPLTTMMQNTTYRSAHALPGRQRNIEEALRLL
jgi:Endonuclease/Exonuclease/phosphatase family